MYSRREFLKKTALGLASAMIGSVVLGCKKKDIPKPNILIIVIDDQGYADLSAFSHHASDIHTPNMDRLAKGGTLFTQAYVTAPVCSPSRTGWNTGKCQFRWDKKAGWGPGLPESVKTLAEYMKENGYVTGKIGKNDYGKGYHKHNVREYPLNHGYDYFLGFSAHAHDYWLLSDEIRQRTPDPDGTSAHLGPLMYNDTKKSYEHGYTTEIFTDEAIAFIKRNKTKPFFLTLTYNSVHHLVHEVPEKYLKKYGVNPIPNYDPDKGEAFGKLKPGTYRAYYEKYSRIGAISSEDMRKYYLANLNCLDDNIGRLLDAMKEMGLDKNTLVIFFADNGGSPLTGACNAPLTGGKYSLHEGGIRVPMIWRWPGHIPEGQVYKYPVSTLDILPSCLAAIGKKADDPTLDGINILPAIQQNKPARAEDDILIWRWQSTFALRSGDWKLTNVGRGRFKGEPSHLYIKPKFETEKIRLFNLKNDPGETVDLSNQYPDIAQKLKSAYEKWLKDQSGKY